MQYSGLKQCGRAMLWVVVAGLSLLAGFKFSSAARNEYDSEPRHGQRFEEFATRLMGGRQRIEAELDEGGEAAINVPPGRWWIHAEVEGERELAWRLPIEITGREKTIELTKENAYLRAKRF